ncbi:unnamed protein product, partial [Scytosiphon promiscuus]
ISLVVEQSQLSPGSGVLAGSSRSLLPRAPPPSLSSKNRASSPSEPRSSWAPTAGLSTSSDATVAAQETTALTFDALLARCATTLGVPGGARTRESLRRALKAWSEESATHAFSDGDSNAQRSRRSRQRPSLPLEARGRTRAGSTPTAAAATGQSDTDRSSLLAVRGSQVDSSVNKDRQLAMAQAASARWERRYSQQASATEMALLEARNAKISLREVERVLTEERSDAVRAAHDAAVAAAEAAEELRDAAEAREEREDGLKASLTESAEHSLQSTAIREQCEKQLRQRLQVSASKLVAAEAEVEELREALKAAERNKSLQPVVVGLGQILTECLASLGLVRGVPEGEFHTMISALRDRAKQAARGFLSVEGLHAAAEGARALDEMRGVRAQLQEAMLDASRQRARRVTADARLKEKEMGEVQRAFVKDDLVRARKETEEMRARMAVAEAEVKQLKESLKKEQERSAAAWAASIDRSAPIADVQGIFDEGHRIVQAKMRLKARQIQEDLSQMQQKLAAERLREMSKERLVPSKALASAGRT